MHVANRRLQALQVWKEVRWFSLQLVTCSLLLVFSGCIPIRTPAPRIPPPSDSIGRSDFRLAVQEYERENYPQAIRSFMMVLERYPGDPILEEAEWMLAKSYEANGDDRPALEEYRRFMRNYPDSDHLYEVKLRADVLGQALEPPSLPESRSGLRAVQLTPQALINGTAFESTVRTFSRNGINALIIPMVRPGGPLPGVFFKTDLAPVVQDLLGPALTTAHDHKLRVFASLPLRQMGWLRDADWLDARFDRAAGRFIADDRLNLWNFKVQNYLLALSLDLAAYPIDGLIIEEPVGYSATEGFHEMGIERFNKDFGLNVTPSQLYGNGSLTPDFWRWAGWKNRQVMAVLKRLVHELHVRQPQMQIALATSKEAVRLPREALLQYGQDILEARQAEFDFFVLNWPLSAFRSEELTNTVSRINDLFPDPTRFLFRIELENPSAPPDNSLEKGLREVPEVKGFPFAFVSPGESFGWVQRLPPALLPARAFP